MLYYKYPYTELPFEYDHYKNGNPYPTKCKIERPIQPTANNYKEPNSFGWFGFAAAFAGFMILVFAINLFSGEKLDKDHFGAFVFFVFIIIVFVLIHNSISKKQKDVEERNRISLEVYNHKLAEHNKAYREFMEFKAIQENQETDFQYRKKHIDDFFQNVTKAETHHKTKRGINEAPFIKLLKEIFGNSIKTDLIIEYFPNENSFQPDIIFNDEERNIWIDIEIDEPYDSITKEPIHFTDYTNTLDEKRDRYFTENGWFVIRFSETQIVNSPMECAKYINDFLITDFSISEYNYIFYDTLDLPDRPRWDYDQALTMVKFDSRNLNRKAKSFSDNPFEEIKLLDKELQAILLDKTLEEATNDGIITNFGNSDGTFILESEEIDYRYTLINDCVVLLDSKVCELENEELYEITDELVFLELPETEKLNNIYLKDQTNIYLSRQQ
jgi:hypothetical protein